MRVELLNFFLSRSLSTLSDSWFLSITILASIDFNTLHVCMLYNIKIFHLICNQFLAVWKNMRIWLSLFCVPWFPGYAWRFIYLQKGTQSLETREHMTNLKGLYHGCGFCSLRLPRYWWTLAALAALLIVVNFNLSNAPSAQDNLSKLLTALIAKRCF